MMSGDGILWNIYRSKKALKSAKTQSFTLTTANTPYLIPTSPQSDREILVIYNGSGSIVYWGGSDVTTNNGIPIADGKYHILPAVNNIYLVCGSNSKSVRIGEMK